MSDRIYRLIFGMLMLISLYFNLRYLVYFLIATMIVEGVTNWRVPLLVGKLRGIPASTDVNAGSSCRINVDAERVWRLAIGFTFLLAYVIFHDPLWFVPWFLAFVIFGAGASDVCPGLIAIRKAGCK